MDGGVFNLASGTWNDGSTALAAPFPPESPYTFAITPHDFSAPVFKAIHARPYVDAAFVQVSINEKGTVGCAAFDPSITFVTIAEIAGTATHVSVEAEWDPALRVAIARMRVTHLAPGVAYALYCYALDAAHLASTSFSNLATRFDFTTYELHPPDVAIVALSEGMHGVTTVVQTSELATVHCLAVFAGLPVTVPQVLGAGSRGAARDEWRGAVGQGRPAMQRRSSSATSAPTPSTTSIVAPTTTC